MFLRIYIFISLVFVDVNLTNLAQASEFIFDGAKAIRELNHIVREQSLKQMNILHHCPLRTEANYYEQLVRVGTIVAGLEGTACYEKQKMLVEELRKFSASVDRITVPFYKLTNPANIPSKDQIAGSNAGGTFVAIGNENAFPIELIHSLAEQADCRTALIQKGLVPALAETVIGFGQLGLMSSAPAPVNWKMGLAGFASGQLIKIVSSLIYEKFNFHNAGDREQFMSLACAHYYESSFIENYSLTAESTAYTLSIPQMVDKLHALDALQRQLEADYDSKNQSLLALESKNQNQHAGFNDATVKLWQILIKLKPKLDMTAIDASLSLDLTLYSRDLREYLKHLTFPFLVKDSLVTLLEQLDPSHSLMIEKLSDSKRNEEYIRPAKIYLNQLFEILNNENKKIIGTNRVIAPNGAVLTFETAQQINAIEFKNATRQYELLNKFLNQRIFAMQRIASSGVFSENDESSKGTFAILEQNQKIQNVLFGHEGAKFYNYLINKSQTHLKFVLTYQGQILSEMKIKTAQNVKAVCRNVKIVRDEWHLARYSAETAFDYLKTISPFVQNLRFKKKFGMFPSVSQPRLVNELNAVEAFEAFQKSESKQSVYPAYLTEADISNMMIKLKAIQPQMEQVEAFYQSNNCAN